MRKDGQGLVTAGTQRAGAPRSWRITAEVRGGLMIKGPIHLRKAGFALWLRNEKRSNSEKEQVHELYTK